MELKIFEKTQFGSVRVVMKDGEPWFAARNLRRRLIVRNIAPRTDEESEKGGEGKECAGKVREGKALRFGKICRAGG